MPYIVVLKMNIIPFTDKRYLSYPVGMYMQDAIQYIKEVTPFIKDLIGAEPVNIWVRGSSGAILAALLVSNLDNECYIQHIKKEGEQSHHSGFSYRDVGYNMILDDFCRSGETLNAIWNEASRHTGNIDLLVLANMCKEEWCLDFKPENLLIDKASIHESWGTISSVSMI